ncbi:hypothetical protein EDB89DRAFT_2062947 [Lactarius sanguifluus]|nr:hypothetical protein EDB89DRAFT_2062947 [Lactarius sanguifluus]
MFSVFLQFSVLSVLAAVPLINFATPLNHIPPSWETLGHPPAGTTIDLHVALKAHDENALVDALYEVSTPRSPKHVLSNNPPRRTMYSHLCRCSVVDIRVSSTPGLHTIVYSDYSPRPSRRHTAAAGWLTITEVPVSQANELLGASYQLYRRTGTNDTTVLRTIGYVLPMALHTHVQTVAPTTSAPVGGTADMAPQPAVTPADLRWLYAYMPAATDRNMIGIVGFGGDCPSTDLTRFMLKRRTDANDATFKVERINGGGYNPNNPDEEPNQNIQYALDIAYPTPLTFYSVGGNNVYDAKTKEPPPTYTWRGKTRVRLRRRPADDQYFFSAAIQPDLFSLCNFHGLCGAAGRGIPDISAQAFKFSVVLKNVESFMGDTSCAAPTVAGIISLLNDFLISNDEEPLGWLNCWLYWLYDDGLYDVTSGSYPGCGTDGFSAIAGWDPVPGLGTPRFPELQKIVGLVDTDPE